MLYYNRIDSRKVIDLGKSNNSKECMICHYFFFKHGFEFQFSVCNGGHDLSVLCINISDIATITVKNVDYCCIIHNISKSEAINLLENSVLEDREYIKKIVLILNLFKTVFLFSIYKIVDITDVCKSLYISIGKVMKNPEIIKFIPDHLKTKRMCKHAVKKLPYLLRYVPDQYKTRQICEKAILENGGILKCVPGCYKNHGMCNKGVDNYLHVLEFVPEYYKAQKM